jgi:hypothetical protein
MVVQLAKRWEVRLLLVRATTTIIAIRGAVNARLRSATEQPKEASDQKLKIS